MRAAIKEERTGEGWSNGYSRFLVDGFPRKMDQAVKFDMEVCPFADCFLAISHPSSGLLVFPCPILFNDRRCHAQTSARTWKDQWAGG